MSLPSRFSDVFTADVRALEMSEAPRRVVEKKRLCAAAPLARSMSRQKRVTPTWCRKRSADHVLAAENVRQRAMKLLWVGRPESGYSGTAPLTRHGDSAGQCVLRELCILKPYVECVIRAQVLQHDTPPVCSGTVES